MKRFVMILMLSILPIGVHAQNSWEIKAGANLSKWTGYIGTKRLPGYEIGVTKSFYLAWILSVQPSLLLSAKGADIIMMSDEKSHARQFYLELPVKLNARVPFATTQAMNFSAGPYIAYGIAGRIHGTIPTVWYDYDSDIVVDAMPRSIFGPDGLKRFETGIEFSISYEINAVCIGIDYQAGFTNIANHKFQETRLKEHLKSSSFSLWVGYKF